MQKSPQQQTEFNVGPDNKMNSEIEAYTILQLISMLAFLCRES